MDSADRHTQIYSANWVNQLQPLSIAGLAFCNGDAGRTGIDQSLRLQNALCDSRIHSFGFSASVGDRKWLVLTEGMPWGKEHRRAEEFAAEKIALLKHMARIERETGCKTSERAAQLPRFWGIEF